MSNAHGDDFGDDMQQDASAAYDDAPRRSSRSPETRRDDDRPRSRSRSPARVYVPPAPRRPPHAPAAEPSNVLGVFGLSIRTIERDLEDEFNRSGKVEKVVIVYDARTQRSRGFGFVTMETLADAQRAIEDLNGLDLHGRRIRVDYSATKRPHDPTPGAYRGTRRDDDIYDRRGGGRGDDRYSGDRRGGDDRWASAPRRDDRYGSFGGGRRYDDDRRGGGGGGGYDGGRRDYGGGRDRSRSPPRRRRDSRSPSPRRDDYRRASPPPREA